MKKSRKELILQALQEGIKSTIQLNKIDTRFGARIHDLREAGYTIITRPVKKKGHPKPWKEYELL